MFKNFLSAIVGGDEPTATPPKSPEPTRPPSQPPSGRSTPMSETGSIFGGMGGGGRRGSTASSQSQISPVDMSDLDLSNLSEAERAQIEAVIARAREMQEEGEQRVREIEEEFGDNVFQPIPTAHKPSQPPTNASHPQHQSATRPSSLSGSSGRSNEPPKTLPKPTATSAKQQVESTAANKAISQVQQQQPSQQQRGAGKIVTNLPPSGKTEIRQDQLGGSGKVMVNQPVNKSTTNSQINNSKITTGNQSGSKMTTASQQQQQSGLPKVVTALPPAKSGQSVQQVPNRNTMPEPQQPGKFHQPIPVPSQHHKPSRQQHQQQQMQHQQQQQMQHYQHQQMQHQQIQQQQIQQKPQDHQQKQSVPPQVLPKTKRHVQQQQQQQPQIVQVKQDEKVMCPLCTSTELKPDVGSTCSVCETHVCLTCGTFETSPRTRLKEWLCKTCSQERRVMQQKQQQKNEMGKQKPAASQNGSVSTSKSKQPTLKPERQSRGQRKSPESGQKATSKTTKQQQSQQEQLQQHLQHPGINAQRPVQEPSTTTPLSSGNIDKRDTQSLAKSEFKQSFPVPRQSSTEGPGRQAEKEAPRGVYQQQQQPQHQSTVKTMASKTDDESDDSMPEVTYGTIKRMPASHQKQANTQSSQQQQYIQQSTQQQQQYSQPVEQKRMQPSFAQQQVPQSHPQQQQPPAQSFQQPQSHTFQPIQLVRAPHQSYQQQTQQSQYSQNPPEHDGRQQVKYPQQNVITDQSDKRIAGVGADQKEKQAGYTDVNKQRQQQPGYTDINKQRRDVTVPSNIPIPQDTANNQRGVPENDAISPADKRKSPRPNNLEITTKPKSVSPVTNSNITKASVEQQQHEKQVQQPHAPTSTIDIANQPRTGAEGAEAPSSAKKKPSPLTRVPLNEVPHHEMERTQSPSRRSPSRASPRSPPRSPSWMRYRDSPPRSPKNKKGSPTKSPAERFPSTYSDMPQGEREGTYGEEFQFPDNDSHNEVDNIMNQVDNHYADMPPPKPARMNAQYGYNGESYDNLAPNSLDLASYAATVASSTAHLTSMSVSPTNLPPHEANRMSPDRESLSPPSPNYYDDMEDIDMADPSEKSIDYGNKRQKVKPPTTDWSPITDLSPILDVSPSVEKIEQEKMLQEQRGNLGVDTNFQLHDDNGDLQAEQKMCSVAKVNTTIDQKGLPNRHKGYEDSTLSTDATSIRNKEVQLKGTLQYNTADDFSGSERRSRHDGYQQNLPHANSEPVKPTQQTDYPSRQAYSFDSDARFAPAKPSQSGQRDKNVDYRHDRSNKEYHSHPSFEGDREIDLDLDIPPQKKGERKEQGLGGSTTFERQGGLVRSKLQIFSKDLIEDTNVDKQKSDDSKTSKEPRKDDDAQSPNYKVLTSPQSPKQEIQLGFDPTKEISNSELTANKEFMYPSPVTTPEKATSPPQPASPSASVNDVTAMKGPDKARTMARSMSLEERSNTSVKRSSSSGEVSVRSQSPGSSGSDREKKNRRKLPSLPQSEKQNQSETVKTNGNMNADKEFLRKRLQEKEAQRNKLKVIKESDTKRPQSAPPCSHKNNDVKNGLPKQPPKVAPKPKLPKILGSTENSSSKEKPPVPPKPRSRTSSTCSVASQEETIDTVNIYGIEVPLDVRSMKQRIKEELQIVTATRRLKIDEMEEVRIMERKLADREQQRRLRMEDEARKKAKMKEEEAKEKERIRKLENEILKQREIERQLDKERMEAESKALAEKYAKAEKESKNISISNASSKHKYTTPTNASLTLAKMSPQASPRRGKHRRQNSDPMLAKFSPIEERDIENEMSYRLGIEARKLSANLSRFSPQLGRRGIRSGSATPPASYSDYNDPLMKGSLIGSGRSKSSEVLTMIDKDSMLASSHSETNIPLSLIHRSRTHHFTNEEDKLSKEEKRHQLQIEIEKRRKALEENARLRYEIQKLTEAANITAYDFEEAKTKYKHHVSKKSTPEYVPCGIIRPLDQLDHDNEDLHQLSDFSAKDYSDYMMQRSVAKSFPQPSYSSTEYIAHHRGSDRPIKAMQDGVDMYCLQPPGECLGDIYYKGLLTNDLDMIEKLGYQHALGLKNIQGFAGSRDSGLSSGSNIMDPYMSIKPEIEICAPDTQSEASVTTTDTTPPSLKDATPAMPILDDVTLRSRSKLRQIGSRPLSDDMGQYLDVTDMAAMFRAESDHSMAESDDHVMEGGVTIKQRTDVKKPVSSNKYRDNIERQYYSFVTKRILLTKDPKERSVQGNGIGMKIVGGKIIPGTEEVGAYVAAIYPGGIADQLHGELQEGDQVLEWNGIPLTGKTYEEVQHIISQPNGEIELVVRPGAKLSCKDQTMSTIRSESCHSSYDNLELTTSDYEEFDGRFIDPRSDMDPDLIASRGRLNNNNPSQQQQSQEQPQQPHHHHHHIQQSHPRLVQPPAKQQSNHHPQQSMPQQHHPSNHHSPHRPGQAPPQHHMSPGASPSSSQQDMYLTPSVSMSNSTQSDPNDPPSPTVELPPLGADPETYNRDPHDWGEIQLQLSYDDYDGTLNIHVMQAKGLRPKDRNGLSDPFVKCYLLPGRIGENKRRTKIITRCLDPEWHQTLVFMKISKEDLYSKTLEVAVWDYDRFKPNDFLGVVYLDLGDSAILDNKPHWYKLHEPDDDMANQLSKPVTYAPTNPKQNIIKPHGHSHPIDLDVSHNNHRHHHQQMHHDPHQRVSSRMALSSSSSGGPDQRDLHPPHPDHQGAKYSPGLGRRKDILAQRNEKEGTVPKKIYLDLKSTNCDDYFCLPQENGIDNMAMHVLRDFETSPNNNNNYENPLLSAFKARHHPSDTTSVSSTSSGVSFDSRIVKSISDVTNDNIPAKNIVNNMYSFLGPGQLLTNKRGPSSATPTGSAFAVTGEILLGLKKSVSKKEIVISVIHCKGVTKRVLVPDAVQDWYVKVYVGQGDNHSRVRKRKTSIQRTEKDPTFHETFNILTDLSNLFAEVSLWINRGMFGQNKAIGTTIISFDNIDFAAYKNNELMAYYKFLAPK